MDFTRDAIKYLYENDLRHGSLEKCKQYLEKKYNTEIEDFDSMLLDFKTEILDYLLIMLCNYFSKIEEVKKVIDKLEDIQALISIKEEEND